MFKKWTRKLSREGKFLVNDATVDPYKMLSREVFYQNSPTKAVWRCSSHEMWPVLISFWH